MKNIDTDAKRQRFIADFAAHFMDNYDQYLQTGTPRRMLDNDDPNVIMRFFYTWYFKHKHSGQVIPVEEAEMILQLAGQISLVPCVCRMANKGVKENLCMVFFQIPEDNWKLRHFDLEKDIIPLEVVEAQQQVREFSNNGLVQTVWTFNSPHIGAVCNCDYPYCTAVRFRRNTNVVQSLFKSEYIAQLDKEKCTNCRKCINKCQFGAMNFSTSTNEVYINELTCFGCGVCRTGCTQDAITLSPRIR